MEAGSPRLRPIDQKDREALKAARRLSVVKFALCFFLLDVLLLVVVIGLARYVGLAALLVFALPALLLPAFRFRKISEDIKNGKKQIIAGKVEEKRERAGPRVSANPRSKHSRMLDTVSLSLVIAGVEYPTTSDIYCFAAVGDEVEVHLAPKSRHLIAIVNLSRQALYGA
jgi:hypothetical protein